MSVSLDKIDMFLIAALVEIFHRSKMEHFWVVFDNFTDENDTFHLRVLYHSRHWGPLPR